MSVPAHSLPHGPLHAVPVPHGPSVPWGDPAPVVERVVVLAGCRTRVLEVEGHGPPVLLLHGFSDSADGWRPVLGELAARGRSAVAVDLPGHGRAARPRADRELLPQLVAFAAAAAAWTGERPVVVGNSLGGLVALLLAADGREPLSGIVPVSPAGCDYAVWLRLAVRPLQLPLVPLLLGGAHALLPPSVVHAVLRVVIRGVVPVLSGCGSRAGAGAVDDPALSGGSAFPGGGTAAFADAYARHLAGRGTRRCMIDMLARLAREAVGTSLPLDAVACPVMLVWGDRDPVTPPSGARRLLAAVPGVRHEVLRGAGHLPQIERPGRIADLVEDFAPAERGEVAPAG